MKFTHFEVVNHILTSNVSNLNTDQSRTSEMPIRNNTRYESVMNSSMLLFTYKNIFYLKAKKLYFYI